MPREEPMLMLHVPTCRSGLFGVACLNLWVVDTATEAKQGLAAAKPPRRPFLFSFPGIIKTTPAIFIIYFIAQTIGTMTTPTASAVVSLESAELPRNNAARSAGQISSTSISDRGTRSGGPVDLDETQQTIDSETVETVETNTLTCNPSARDDGAHVQEQNAGSVQDAGVPSGTDVVMQNLLDDMVRAHTLISLVCS